MKKKLLSALLSVALVSVLLTGCGSGKESSGDSGGETGSAGSEESAGEEDGGSGKLVYWSMWSEEEPQAQVISKAIDQYMEDTGVKVDVQFKGRTGQREGLQAALDANQQIDLFDEGFDRVNGSWGAYLMDLEDLAADFEAEHGNPTLYKIARESSPDGKLRSIPYQPSIFGFFYNKEIFEKAGIAGTPDTWEELGEDCEKIKEAGYTPLTADTAYFGNWIGYQLARHVGQNAVRTLVKDPSLDEDEKVEITWDDERVRAALAEIEDFASKGYFSETIASNIYPTAQNQEFAAGEAAIIICGSWLPNELKEAVPADFQWGYFNFPAVENGADGVDVNYISNQVFGINKNCEMPEEAMELIAYITSGEFDLLMVEEALCIPADFENSDWPEELADVQEPFNATTGFYQDACGSQNNADFSTDQTDMTARLMAGQMTADEFIEQAKAVLGE